MKYGRIISPNYRGEAKIGKTYVFCDDILQLCKIQFGANDTPLLNLPYGVLTAVELNPDAPFWGNHPFRRDDLINYKYILEVLEDDKETEETKNKYGKILDRYCADEAVLGKRYVFADEYLTLKKLQCDYEVGYTSYVIDKLVAKIGHTSYPFKTTEQSYQYAMEILEDSEKPKETEHNAEPVEDDWPILSAETADKAVIGKKYYLSDDIEALKRIKSGGECTCCSGTLTGINEYPFSKGSSLFSFKFALEIRDKKPEKTEEEKDKISIRHYYRPFESIAELKDEYNKLNGYLRSSKPLIWIRREEDNTEEPILSYDYNEKTVSTLNYDMSLQELFDTCMFVISGEVKEKICGVRR